MMYIDNEVLEKMIMTIVARYREKGLIRYYQTDENGKNFYRSSDVQEFLQQRGKKK